MTFSNWDDLLACSYNPYSNKPAAAICLDENMMAYPGVRIENAAFPETISSFQSAIYSCLSNNGKPKELLYPFIQTDENAQFKFFVDEFNLEFAHVSDISELNWYHPYFKETKSKLDELKKLVELAQVKHSHFPVTALLETESGYLSGVNIEVSDWRLGLCAERVAIAKAISYGAKSIGEMHVFAPKAEFCSPCGGCRQVIAEHFPDKRLYLYHKDETHTEIIAQYLLPHSFSSANLQNK